MPRARRRSVPLALLLCPTLALSACGTGGAGGSDDAEPQSGGHLTFALGSDPTCVDPQQVASNDAIYPARQLVDSLTDQDPKTGKIVPWLATSWKVSKDATSFTFRLRKGVTFSDGSPVDAQAVKENFDGILRLGAKAQLGAGYLEGYKNTKVVDEHTARVTFEQPNAQFLQATSTFSLGLLAKSTTKLPASKRCTGNLVGSGPFTLDGYTPNNAVEESRRKGYSWGSSLFQHKGAARLDKLTFKVTPESGVRTGSLQSGQVDAASGVAPQDEKNLKAQGVHLNIRANPGLPFALSANVARPLTKDPAVRAALQQAVNSKEVVDTVLSDSYQPATSALSTTTDSYQSQAGLLRFDPKGAKRKLARAGWRSGPGGIRTKDGKKLKLALIYATNFGQNQAALELVQQQLRKVGVAATLQPFSIGEYDQVRKKGDYDYSWGNTTRTDPDILRNAFSRKLLDAQHLRDPELQQLLDEQAAEADAKKRAAKVAEIQRLVLKKGYQIPVFELTTVIGQRENVHQLDFEASSRLQFHDTWLS